MKFKLEWMNTFLIGFALSVCLLTIIDIAYDDPIWGFSIFSLRVRIVVVVIITGLFYFLNSIFRRIALSSINEKKNEKKVYAKEYILVFLISFILTNILHIIIVNYITEMGFRWKESLLTNIMATLLSFLYYTIIRNWILFESLMEQSLQLEKIKVDQLETELKFLKSQYHPHFLFNALNTIYFQVDENNKDAKQSIEQLSNLLRYQLYDIDKEVTIEQEINYLKSYIAFQQKRMSERLVSNIYFDTELKDQKIHPLLFQPLIENAFKYVRGEYRMQLEMKLNESQIEFEMQNSVSPQSQRTNNKKNNGIGIENLKRRLDLLYPNKYNLEIKQTENMFVVKLVINTN